MVEPGTDTGGSGQMGTLLGPYEAWLFDAGKTFDLPDLMLKDGVHLSAVAELSNPVAIQDVARLSGTLQSALGKHVMRQPVLYRAEGFTTRFLPFLISPAPGSTSPPLLEMNAAAVQNLVAQFCPGNGLPSGTQGRFRMNFPVRSETVGPSPLLPAAVPPRDEALAGEAPGVILAIIDLGIPFAHANFRHPGTDRTRIDYCWAQSAPANGPGDVLFGREFRRDQIDAMLATHRGDEDAVYAAAGLLSRPDGPPMPLSRAASHGAHCLDLMAGGWPAASAAKARIIAVDLPSSPIWETSGFGKDMFILAALHYIFDRADLIRQSCDCTDLPLVINLSYGNSGGPHDGTSLIEAALAELVGFRNAIAPTTLLMPSGNTFQDQLFAHLTDRHFAPDPAEPGSKVARLQWFAPPNDRTSSFLEMWYPPGTAPEDIRVEVSPPLSGPAARTDDISLDASGSGTSPIRVAGKVVGHLTKDLHRLSRWRAMVLLAPSETFAAEADLVAGPNQYGTAPAGLWTLTFRLPAAMVLPEAAADGNSGIQCRIQRDSSYGQGNTGARQSHFVDPLDLPYAAEGNLSRVDQTGNGAVLRRFGTLNGMATGAATVVVGGLIAASGKAAEYASAGLSSAADAPVCLGKPVDLSVQSERAPVVPGLIAAGTRSSTTVAASGTSSACPQAARLLALSQITAPLPGDASHTAVLSRLASLPMASAVTEDGHGPASRLRLGPFVVQT
jgi:hypothetical protein